MDPASYYPASDRPVSMDGGQARRIALHRYHILDTPPEESFDRITKLASHLFDVPIAIINLIDGDRQWFKSCVGLDIKETDLDNSICTTTIQTPGVLAIPDLREDVRFADSPFVVGEPGFRFYMGAPLTTPDGFRLGTLCVLDTTPHNPSSDDYETLSHLADMVMDAMKQHALNRQQRAALESIQAAFLTVDRDWHITYANERAVDFLSEEECLGIKDALLGELLWEKISEHERNVLQLPLRRALEDDTSVQVICEQEDTGRSYRVEAAPFDQGLSVSLKDITEERVLSEENQLLATAMNQLNEAVLITGTNMDEGPPIVYANPAFERMTGYTAEELEGASPRMLQGPETDRAVIDDLRAHFENGQTWIGETVNYRKDGTPYIVRWDIAPVLNDAGECTHWVSIQNDVTEQRERQAQLRKQRNLLAQTQRLAGAWEFDLCTDTVRRTEEVYRIYEMDKQDSLSVQDALMLYPEEARETMRNALNTLIETGTTYDLTLPIQTAKGNDRWVRTVGGVIDRDSDGAIIKVGGAVQDITDRKEAEKRLVKAKEKAEEMSRLKTAFLANMSHEIRTPLTSIMGFSELLNGMKLKGRAQQCAALIHKGGKRLLHTLNAVLDLSQLEANAVELKPAEMDVVSELREALHPLRLNAEKAGVQMHVEAPTCEVMATLDASAFRRIVTHLVDNAIKFTSYDGTVSVRLESDPAVVRLTVQDSGVGIDDAFIPHLFEAFKQESTGDARGYEGNGVGLAITKHLIDLMDGEITVDTVKGQGTTFTVELPRHATPAEANR